MLQLHVKSGAWDFQVDIQQLHYHFYTYQYDDRFQHIHHGQDQCMVSRFSYNIEHSKLHWEITVHYVRLRGQCAVYLKILYTKIRRAWPEALHTYLFTDINK